MNADEGKEQCSRLSGKTQLAGFVVGTLLSGLLLGGMYLLVRLASQVSLTEASPPVASIFVWAIVGGFVGGAGRSLFMFIWEVGGHARKQPSYYLDRWFLYLVKPAMGSAGGIFFFLAVNLGLVGLYSDTEPALEFKRVCLTAVLGGIFFESVFAQLSGLMPREHEPTTFTVDKPGL